MGASQERADFFGASLLVVTRHPGGPTGRPKIHPVLPRFALFFILLQEPLVKTAFNSSPSRTKVRPRGKTAWLCVCVFKMPWRRQPAWHLNVRERPVSWEHLALNVAGRTKI